MTPEPGKSEVQKAWQRAYRAELWQKRQAVTEERVIKRILAAVQRSHWATLMLRHVRQKHNQPTASLTFVDGLLPFMSSPRYPDWLVIRPVQLYKKFVDRSEGTKRFINEAILTQFFGSLKLGAQRQWAHRYDHEAINNSPEFDAWGDMPVLVIGPMNGLDGKFLCVQEGSDDPKHRWKPLINTEVDSVMYLNVPPADLNSGKPTRHFRLFSLGAYLRQLPQRFRPSEDLPRV